MKIYYILILFMTITSSLASFFIKKSTVNKTIISIITSKFLYIGGFLYLLVSFLNIWILKLLPYSVVVPIGSITYIWTMFIAGIFLKEKIGIGKIIGVLLIIAGVICIAV